MSHTDLAIRAHIQALDLKLFRLSVTGRPEQKLPIKIPLKPMKTVAHAIDKVRYLRFSRSKGYHIGLIPLEPHHFTVIQTEQLDRFLPQLQQHNINVLYVNAAYAQIWLHRDAWNANLENLLHQSQIPYQILDPNLGQAALAGFLP